MTSEQITLASRAAFILLCVVLVFTTLAYGAVHQPVIAVFYVLTGALIVLLSIDVYQRRQFTVQNNLMPVLLLALAAYGLVQVIPFGTLAQTAGVDGIPRTISLNPFATQVSALHMLFLFFLFVAVLSLLNTAGRLRWTVYVIAIFGFAFAFFAILQSVLSPQKIYGIYEAKYAVPFGSFVSRHNFAAFMELSLAIPLGMIFSGSVRPDKRLLYITAIALMGIALLLCGSRGGLVAFLAEIICVLFFAASSLRRSFNVQLALSVILIALVIGGAVFVGGDTSFTRIAETAATDDLTTGRTHIWQVAVEIIRAYFPLGVGLGAFGVAYTQFDSMSGLERVEQAHNDFLQIVTDAGLVGIVLGGFFIYGFAKLGMRIRGINNQYRRGVAVGAFAGCLAVLVHSLVDFVLHTTAISVLFIIVLSVLIASLTEYPDDFEDTAQRIKRKRTKAKISSISQSINTRATEAQ